MAQIKSSVGLQISYDDKKENVIRRHLPALLQSLGTGGMFIGLQVSEPLHVLGSLLAVEGIQDEDVKRHIIFEAAIQLQARPDSSIEDWVEAIGKAGQNYLNRPIQEYHVLLPLNVEPRVLAATRPFSIQGVELQCDNWANVQQAYAIDKLVGRIHTYLESGATIDLWSPWGTPMLAKIRARNSQEAFERAADSFDLLRAILNFLHDRNRFQLQKPEPLGSVFPPVGYGVFSPDGTVQDAFVNVEHLSFQRCVLTQVNLAGVLNLLNKLNLSSQARGTVKVFAEALRAYNRALDATNWQDAYLSLWQSVEIMTAFDLGQAYKMTDVVKRATVLLGKNEIAEDFLNVCADKRNDLVHRGQFSSDGQSEVLLLKSMVRHCLLQFFDLVSSYPTVVSLSEFFRHVDLSSDQLAERKRVIETILARPTN